MWGVVGGAMEGRKVGRCIVLHGVKVGEGQSRDSERHSYWLPEDQCSLVENVTIMNKRTIDELFGNSNFWINADFR